MPISPLTGRPYDPIPDGPIDRGPLGAPTAAQQRQELAAVLTKAGVDLGQYDKRIAAWLAEWEWSTVATIAAWIKRANRD